MLHLTPCRIRPGLGAAVTKNPKEFCANIAVLK